MQEKLWVFRAFDSALQNTLARQLSISPVTASVLLARGVTTPGEATRWMSSVQGGLHDPFLLPDIEPAVERLHAALSREEQVCFYGDYDVDGVSATSLYLSFYQGLGGNACGYIPHRVREGYGLNEGAVRRLAQKGVTLLVTSDCGTTSHHEIAVAKELGMDVIVTDHHQTDATMPAALAVLNPHRRDAVYPFKGLCSAGLAYKVVSAYQQRYGSGDVDPESCLDLVALATVADIVPLQDENRILVREGLRQITRGARCGLRALKQVAGIAKDCTSETIGFRLGPRLNAAGRLDHAMLCVQLLTTNSDQEAMRIAEQLEQLNRQRQQVEEGITEEAAASLKDEASAAAIVLGSRDWHLGVVGIVAARLVDRFHRPSIVIAIDDQGVGKGSARTVEGFDLYQGLSECKDLLEAYGGHPSAAGLTLKASRLEEFRRRFCDVAAQWAGSTRRVPTLHVDAEVKLTDVNFDLIQELESLHPFGAGNPEPTLAVRGLDVVDARVVGEKHLKLRVRQGRSFIFDSIGFRMGSYEELGLRSGRPVDLAFSPERNHWNGYDRVQLRIKALRMSGEVS
ncbi:MAG: single-stranded-DNA-specific exonuclease RecJ [Nitrospira sp.]|nr:single-stranded-DNA-specific exonuclease RecJ [Nitrospira sp.]MBP6606717.1 single-stranded-DNA-specific exonuclease RecJ [Nitrospira sp.]HQY59722.1 single-stranded-DNA-specific exonuclease RecJ [Nitrospira sp.]HRA97900.1 single-stranded-DNA-specific exonuclease RecJ [Nitrospira sp.]